MQNLRNILRASILKKIGCMGNNFECLYFNILSHENFLLNNNREGVWFCDKVLLKYSDMIPTLPVQPVNEKKMNCTL